MSRDFEPIDYDFHKARAHELRRQEIERVFAGVSAWLRALAGVALRLRSGNAPARTAPKLTVRGVPGAHC